MSTVTHPPETSSPRMSAAPGAAGGGARRRGGRKGGTLLVTSAAVALFAIVAYFALRGTTRGDGDAGATTYPVTKRSFTVTLNEKGELEAIRSVDVKCEVEGRSTIIWLIDEGAEVKKGDLVVKLASNEIDDRIRSEQITVQNAKASAEAAQKELEIALDQHKSDIRKAELALNIAQIELNKYMQGDYQLQLLERQLALETAKRTYEQAHSILEDSKKLAEQKFLTARDLEERELAEYKAGVEVEKAQKALEVFQEYDYQKDKQQKESDVEEARKELDRTRKKAEAEEAKFRANAAARQAEFEFTSERLDKYLQQKEKTEVTAPADGLVVYFAEDHWRGADRQIAEGSEVYERQTMIQLPDTSAMKVKVRIHEAKTNKIAIGQRANVEVEGTPGVVFTGQVTKIAPLADSQNRWLNPNLKEYETEITLDPNEHQLKPGVTARVEIVVREVRDVLAVPVQAVYGRNGKSFVFVGKSVEHSGPVEVEIGSSSDTFAEVKRGLEAGDHVVLAQDDSLVAKLPEEVQEQNGIASAQPDDASAQTQAKRVDSPGESDRQKSQREGGNREGPRRGGGGGGEGRRGPRPS